MAIQRRPWDLRYRTERVIRASGRHRRAKRFAIHVPSLRCRVVEMLVRRTLQIASLALGVAVVLTVLWSIGPGMGEPMRRRDPH